MTITQQELADALGRLNPRAREVLELSLRRKVPDTDLATLFSCESSEVARMRADAIEWLADELEVQRGADLGQVLTALLDQATWDLVPTPDAPADHAPINSPEPEAEHVEADDPAPSAPEDPSPDPPASPLVTKPSAKRSRPVDRGAEERRTVLGMLSPTEEEVAGNGNGRDGVNGARSWSIAAAAVIAMLLACGAAAIFLLDDEAGGSADENGARPFTPRQQEIVGDPFPTDPESANHFPIAVVESSQVLLDKPGGKPLVRIARKTDWDSPRVLSVVKREGGWIAVLVPELKNGQSGWMRDDDADRLSMVSWAVKADLSKRTVVVERDGEVVKRMRAGVGRSDHPTPVGRFAVTDKLEVTEEGSPYGCCVLALTGHQTKLPLGWPGGDRLAVHATADLSGLGRRVSLGCMRVHPDQARWLIDSVPLGTPVFIRQ